MGTKGSILMAKHAPFHVVSLYVRIFRNVTPVTHSTYCTVLYAWQIHTGDHTEELTVPKLVNTPYI